jgi:hypothetical protein
MLIITEVSAYFRAIKNKLEEDDYIEFYALILMTLVKIHGIIFRV